MRWRSSLAVVAGAGVCGALTLHYGFTAWDSPTFTYIGRVILNGGAPYRDAWDVKAPGVYFFYALALVLGKAPLSFRILDVLWQGATALVLGSIAVRLFSRQAAGIIAGAAYVLFYFSEDYWNLAQPDGLLSLPAALAVWFALSALERDRQILWGAAAGCVGVAALFKMTMGLLGVAFLGVAIVNSRHSLRRLLTVLASLAVGLAVPFALCAAYFRFHGAWDELLTVLLVVGPQYAATVWKHPNFSFIVTSLLQPARRTLYVAALLGLTGMVGRVRRGEAKPAAEAILIAWGITALLALVLNGLFFGYHYEPLFAPLAVMSAGTLDRFVSEFRLKRRLPATVGLALAVCAAVVPLRKIASHAADARRMLREGPRHDKLQVLADYVRARTAPGDPIFVWGTLPVIYLAADRPSSSRFIHSYFLTDRWKNLNLRPILLRELRANPPACFVVMEGPRKPQSLSEGLPEYGAELDGFALLRQFVDDQYYLDRREEGWIVYLRKSGGPRVLTPTEGAPTGTRDAGQVAAEPR